MNRTLKSDLNVSKPSKSNLIATPQTMLNKKRLHIHVLVALSLLTINSSLHAAPCSDNGDGTFSCSSTSEVIDNALTGELIIDNASTDATLSITTTEAYFVNNGTPASITNFATTVGATSAISFTGNNAVTINNTGGYLDMDRFAAPLNPAGWSSDADGLLYNDKDGLGPVLAGYAAVISAGQNVNALTVNNISIPVSLPDGVNFISSRIGSSGDFDPSHFTAAIFTNTPSLTINNVNATIGNIVSFATGTTIINNDGGSPYGGIYAVDRNPLLVAAQEAYLAANGTELPLAYKASDVGIRNSTINSTGFLSGNIYLGSGAHLINSTNSRVLSNIFVDQRDVAVVDVVGGIATSQAAIHGARTFTLNITGEGAIFGEGFGGQININSVAESVNTINISATAFGNDSYTANGLGINTLNLNCTNVLTPLNQRRGCQILTGSGNVTGFSAYNLSGTKFELQNSVSVTDIINLNAGEVVLNTGSILSAPRVVIGNNTLMQTVNESSIVGNLENNGKINLQSNTLNIDGNTSMNAGSVLQVNVTPTGNGNLNNTGTATFAADSILLPEVNLISFGANTNVRQGETRTIANNVNGLPTVQNAFSLLQWAASENAGNLIITANIGVADFLAPQLTSAAKNAVDAIFSYTGSDTLFTGLQAQLIAQRDQNLIRAAERLHPETNDGAFRMVQGNTDKFFGILESRLVNNYLKATPENMQVAAAGNLSKLGDDNPTLNKGVWVQGFGDRAAQDGLQKFDGYTSSAAGFAGGIDTALDAAGNKHAGLAISYARGNVTNTGNTVNNRADINSFMGSVYGSWAMDDWYINGMIGVGRNTYETFRRLLENTATGKHDSWQFSSRVDVGMPILFSDNLTFVPMASLDYSHIKESGYSENGTSSTPLLLPNSIEPVIVNGLPVYIEGQTPTNLRIDGRTFDSVRGGLGAKAIYTFQQTDWAAELELHGLYRHEFGDVSQDTVAQFVAGGNRFLSPGVNPVRDDFIFGASVRLTGDDENDQLTLLTSYDANIRKQYFGQAMTLNLRYDFDKAPAYKKAAKAKLADMAAKKVNAQNVQATEKDIVAINQAMQSEVDLADDDMMLDENQQEIDRTIKNWTAALSKKNLDVYFNSYAADFTAPDGSSRQQWERKRKAEISKENNPSINISYLTIEPNGNQAIAVFTQTMVADAQEASVRKIVGLENRKGRWLIVSENSMTISQ